MKKSIAVITGGNSSEEVISLQSGQQIMDTLDKEQYVPYLVMIKHADWYVKTADDVEIPIDKNDFSFTIKGEKISFDCIFLAIHGTPAEDGKLQAYFEMLNLPYVGPQPLGAALTFNKYACKTYLSSFGVKTANSLLFYRNVEVNIEKIVYQIGYPCFVKPNEAGSSFGVTKVYEKPQLLEAIDKAFEESEQVLIEKFIKGREFTCGIYLAEEGIKVLPVTEIISSKDFFDYEAKYTPGMANEVTPAEIKPELKTLVQNTTRAIYEHLQLKGIARVDYIYAENSLYLLEVNTIPGMTKESIVPKQIIASGGTMTEVLTELLKCELSDKAS